MNNTFDFWYSCLFLLPPLLSLLWSIPGLCNSHQLLHLEIPAVFLVVCLNASAYLFFRYEPWFGIAGTPLAAVYAFIAAYVLSGLVILPVAFIRYQRQKPR